MKKERMNRDFKGIWIPKEIWLNTELTLIEKNFIAEIDSLDNEDGCYASNAYFSDMFGISKGRCTQIIKSLESKGYISIELIYQDKLIKKRVIRVFNKLNRGIKNIKQGYLENDEDNNTLYNNIINRDFGKYLNDIIFIDNVCMSQKISKEELQLKIEEFTTKCEAFSDKFNNTKHIRSAFVSWLNKNKNNDHVDKAAEFFIKVFNKISNKEYFVTETLKDLLRIQLNNGITKEKLIEAVRNLYDSDESNWHKKQNYIHATPEFLLKEENFNKYSNLKFKKR